MICTQWLPSQHTNETEVRDNSPDLNVSDIAQDSPNYVTFPRYVNERGREVRRRAQITLGTALPACSMPRLVSTLSSSAPPTTKKKISAKIAGR